MDTAQELVTKISRDFKLSDGDIAGRVNSSQPTIWRLRTGESKDCTSTLYRELFRLREELHAELVAGDVRPPSECVPEGT